MEKKIKVEDVIEFLRKCLKKHYDIKFGFHQDISIKNNNDTFHLAWNVVDDTLHMWLTFKSFSSFGSDLEYAIQTKNKRLIAEWELLLEDLKDNYYTNVEQKFLGFFNADNILNINELDDD